MRDRWLSDEPGLTAEQRALLERARVLREARPVPPAVEQRLLRRLSALASGGAADDREEGALPRVSPARLGAAAASWSRHTSWPLLGLAAAFLVLVGAQVAQRSEWGRAWLGAEPEAGQTSASFADGDFAGIAGSPLFHSEARAATPGGPPPAAPSLLSAPPFSSASRAWQIKHWINLRAAPSGDVAYSFDESGALCLSLGRGERVVGAWPWLPEPGAKPEPEELPVALERGQSYRLSFEAWADAPGSAQLLVAMGHAGMPYSAAAGVRVPLASRRQRFEMDFVAESDDPAVGVALLAAAARGSDGSRLCLADVAFRAR